MSLESNSADEERPQRAIVSQKSGVSLIWIVPILALLVGAGLVFTALMKRGPTVTITFKSADGIQAKKTKVKYKNITIGKVKSVKLSQNFSRVRVTVNLAKMAEQFLSDNTRFWIVRPRLRGVTVSGLDTLLSGAYIAVDPGEKGTEQLEFIGLDAPPSIIGDTKGKLFTLKAEALGSLDYGSPIYYRDISVGEVVGYRLREDGRGVDIEIFVNSPYDTYVKEASRFWSVSGVEVEMGADGVHLYSESLVSILLGGIAFIDPPYMGQTPSAKAGDIYTLYKTRKAALTQHFTNKEYYVLKFAHTVRGLSVGAPVEFKGFVIGEVVDIGIEFHLESQQVLVPVRIEVEAERLARMAPAIEGVKSSTILHKLVEKGLRAEVLTANLLTGQLYVALDFFDQAQPTKLELTPEGLQQIPTLPTPIEEFTQNIFSILGQVQKIPIEEIGRQTLAAIKSIKASGDQLRRLAASRDLHAALKKTYEIMKNTNALVAQDSRAVVEVQRMLRDLRDAAKSIRILADQLERNPESLIRGKRRD
jgi:paraquat-inducible protein B